MVKVCRFNPRIRCFWFSCAFVDSRGNVRICVYHRNPFGYFRHKRLSPVLERGF